MAPAPAEADVPRLRRLLGGPELAWLVDRVRRRMAAGQPLAGSVTRTAATPAERAAADRLLGRGARPGRSLSVRLESVDHLLRASGAAPGGLAAAVVVLSGPVEVTRETADRVARAWAAAYVPLHTWCAASAAPEAVQAWCADLEAVGRLRRLAQGDPVQARNLADQAVAVLSALPAAGVTLAVLAARTVGDAHALDPGRPLAALVVSALRAWADNPPEDIHSAEGRRALWASAGVAVDVLSSRVLCLGLPGGTHTTTSRILAEAARAGEPTVLTVRQLGRGEQHFGVAGKRVFVCENPAVVAEAAEALGADCPPLVCVEGNLSVAARLLLTGLAAEGGELSCHADFDWGGVRIASTVMRLTDARPWRYVRADYEAALAAGIGSGALGGTPAATPWNPGLATALTARATRVEEEHLVDTLLADLGAPQ
ncbi:TIGR02679 family protein [Yinghuangia sp. ASG 101]|uniref:TIGR02679 family protein n=1 Tax=Yinghuangia sp. ASG 101 TaxID=2896848 RepID=UPI001E5C0436|nr:TIGR02679 family protein [Yinghuangia sp. ASG 101]UGQ11161.1 TIGR02679 family protein [Yinghuangia sp. ASG 101]